MDIDFNIYNCNCNIYGQNPFCYAFVKFREYIVYFKTLPFHKMPFFSNINIYWVKFYFEFVEAISIQMANRYSLNINLNSWSTHNQLKTSKLSTEQTLPNSGAFLPYHLWGSKQWGVWTHGSSIQMIPGASRSPFGNNKSKDSRESWSQPSDHRWKWWGFTELNTPSRKNVLVPAHGASFWIPSPEANTDSFLKDSTVEKSLDRREPIESQRCNAISLYWRRGSFHMWCL